MPAVLGVTRVFRVLRVLGVARVLRVLRVARVLRVLGVLRVVRVLKVTSVLVPKRYVFMFIVIFFLTLDHSKL